METMHLGLKLSTEITIRQLDAQGKCLRTIVGHNDFTNAASDIFATALLRSGPSSVAFLYARYGGALLSGQEGIIVPADNDIKKTVRGDFVASGGPKGGLWVPLLATPIQSSSDTTIYVGNRITYMFRIPSNISVSQTEGATFDASTSYIAALGLAVSPNFNNSRADDIIMTVLQYPDFTPTPEPFLVPMSGQSAIDYTINIVS
jgi:hypothetical protein